MHRSYVCLSKRTAFCSFSLTLPLLHFCEGAHKAGWNLVHAAQTWCNELHRIPSAIHNPSPPASASAAALSEPTTVVQKERVSRCTRQSHAAENGLLRSHPPGCRRQLPLAAAAAR